MRHLRGRMRTASSWCACARAGWRSPRTKIGSTAIRQHLQTTLWRSPFPPELRPPFGLAFARRSGARPDPLSRPAHVRVRKSDQGAMQLQVLVRDNNVDQALRVLKKKMQREGLFREMKK